MNRHVSEASVPASPPGQHPYPDSFRPGRAGLRPAPNAASQQAGLAAVIGLAQNAPATGQLAPVPAPPGRIRYPVAESPASADELASTVAIARPQQPGPGLPGGTGRHAAAARPMERHGSRFLLFAAIGGVVFLAGFGLQAWLTSGLHMPALASYLIQAVVSVEASFVLNRWLTWRDRDTPFWTAFGRFNLQKTVTIALNVALYAALLHFGMNYLIANVVLTAAFTIVNYVAGDRLVFTPHRARAARAADPPARVQSWLPPVPGVSVVIPCRDNEGTIRDAVLSLLDQDYPALTEIILIGSPGDRTWRALADITDPRLTTLEIQTPPGVRDANYKRDAGIFKTSSDLIALVDSDMVLPPGWMSRAVLALQNTGASCVAGGMRSIHDSFWGRYTDTTVIGAKTPRIPTSYTVTSKDFGTRGRKPPITANIVFTRELYERCPIDPSWSHGSYEDYEWFWRVTRAGYGVHVSGDMFGWHHHRRGLRALTKEYLRSSRGCAYFVRAHRDSPLARRRLREAVVLPLAGLAAVGAAGAAVADGYSAAVAALLLGGLALLSVQQVARSRRLESAAYPVVGLALGLVFTMGLDTHLIRSGSSAADPAADFSVAAEPSARHRPPPAARRFPYPLAAVCAVQAALSLSLVWSNTAFGDEAQYLWAGRIMWAHWLHGASVPVYLYKLSGSPLIYPPLGALAASVGGLAGARVLSLVFMLGATVLLYLTASRLIGRTGALFAAALWALSEPAIRLAFATFDPLSVFLTVLAAWLVVQAGHRRHRGELVALAAAALALANASAYSGIVIDPVVIAFALLVWLPQMPRAQAWSCTGWLTGALLLCFSAVMTATHSWPGTGAVFSRSSPDHQSLLLVLNDIWQFSALIMGLALIGAIAASRAEGRPRIWLLRLLAFAAFLVPIAQLHDQTAWSLDKHLAYGIWFAAIAGGYACSRLIRWFPGSGRRVAAACCVVALIYPAVSSWELAWQNYHAWPDASSFVTAIRPAAASTPGLIYVFGQENIAQYYTPQGLDWRKWTGAISLDPGSVPRSAWISYYADLLNSQDFGVIALFYSTTFRQVSLPAGLLLTQHPRGAYQQLLGLVAQNTGEPGLPALTQALKSDPDYRLVSVGPYDTDNLSGTHDYSIYAIWQKKAQG